MEVDNVISSLNQSKAWKGLIDCDLNWKEHIQQLSKNEISRGNLVFFVKIRHFC